MDGSAYLSFGSPHGSLSANVLEMSLPYLNGYHMMNWWGWDAGGWWFMPFMGVGIFGVWLIFLVIAYLVYKDAENRGMNGLLWALLVILPWVGVPFLIIYLIVRKDRSANGTGAAAILSERYARGEITREEYQQMKRDLIEI